MSQLRPSSASEPDTSSTSGEEIRAAETSHMLQLCEAQIEDALRECDAAVNKLLESFTTIIDDAQWFWRTAGDPAGLDASAAIARGARLVSRANAAIQALQFHDRLTQRLSHVRYSLTSLAGLLDDPQASGHVEAWQALHNQLGRLYRTREEIAIFESMSPKAPSPVRPVTSQSMPATAGSEIELF